MSALRELAHAVGPKCALVVAQPAQIEDGLRRALRGDDEAAERVSKHRGLAAPVLGERIGREPLELALADAVSSKIA